MAKFLISLMLLLGASSVTAAEVQMLGQKNPERKAVLDALRPAIEKQLKSEITFVVTSIQSDGTWALVIADPKAKSGKELDGSKMFGENFEQMDGLRVDALLYKDRGQWKLFQHAIGATDVWYSQYCDPKALPKGLPAINKKVIGACWQ